MRFAAVCACFLTLAAASPARAELTVSMHDGRVTVNATNVTVRQILAEWARVGQTKIVNAEGLAGGPITLQLAEVPEEQALDILLRTAAGYMAAPRATEIANASHYDRIIVMPTSTPSRTSAPPPLVQQRIQPSPDDDDDAPLRNGPPPAPPLAQQLQQAQQALQSAQQSQQGAPPTTYPPVISGQEGQPGNPAAPAPFATPMPAAPAGVSVPGTIVPVPQPGQPASPQGR